MIEVHKEEDCMGCYGCATICPTSCIKMETDMEGFWYPKVDLGKCIECRMCLEVCPIIQKKSSIKQQDDSVPYAYAAYNVNEAIRLDSSSGGLFTLLAEDIIRRNGVVFGAAFNADFQVEHKFVEESGKLSFLRGSKYVQSKIGDAYEQVKQFLEDKRVVLFTGTPCQVSGLKYYLGKEYENLICQDIVCHGVPSPKVWTKYVSYREACADASALRISFRRKNEGWKRYSVSFLFNNDTEYLQILTKDLFMRAFLKDICLRPSCYACKFKGVSREADITLGDFWGIQNVLPKLDDDKGISLVLVHSVRGQAIFKRIKQHLEYEEVDVMDGAQYNSAMIRSVIRHPDRNTFFKQLDTKPIDKLIDALCKDNFSERIGQRIGTTVRVLLLRLGILDHTKKVVARITGK